MRKAQRGIYGVVELARPIHSRAQQPPRVQHHPHSLAALDLIYLGNQMAPARGRRPANLAILIARAKFTQALKLAPPPLLPPQPALHLYLTASYQEKRRPSCIFKIRIDAHPLT